MSAVDAPAAYRGKQSADAFLRQAGLVWIGLFETIAGEEDQTDALAAYFGVQPGDIRRWIEARGRARCSATVPTGSRCANLVGVEVDHDPRNWLAAEHRCAAHPVARQCPRD